MEGGASMRVWSLAGYRYFPHVDLTVVDLTNAQRTKWCGQPIDESLELGNCRLVRTDG